MLILAGIDLGLYVSFYRPPWIIGATYRDLRKGFGDRRIRHKSVCAVTQPPNPDCRRLKRHTIYGESKYRPQPAYRIRHVNATTTKIITTDGRTNLDGNQRRSNQLTLYRI
jgi:hypothetical protein